MIWESEITMEHTKPELIVLQVINQIMEDLYASKNSISSREEDLLCAIENSAYRYRKL